MKPAALRLKYVDDRYDAPRIEGETGRISPFPTTLPRIRSSVRASSMLHDTWPSTPAPSLSYSSAGSSDHPDWSLMVCVIDLRVGGAFRYAWRRERPAEATTSRVGGLERNRSGHRG